jgi:hypothetical protein
VLNVFQKLVFTSADCVEIPIFETRSVSPHSLLEALPQLSRSGFIKAEDWFQVLSGIGKLLQF